MSYLPVGSLKPSSGRRNSYTHALPYFPIFLPVFRIVTFWYTDPDTRVHNSGLPVPIRILIFSPMGFKMPTKNKVRFFSVADPWHFGTDPDPRIRTSDKRILIRILLFSSVTFRMAIKKKIPNFFCLLLFEATFTSFFKDKKSSRSYKTAGIRVFLTSRIRICASYYR